MDDERSEEEQGVWAAFYANPDHARLELPEHRYDPRDWTAREVMAGLRRVIDYLKSRKARGSP